MAANSGGVEWASVVKQILSSYSFTKSDVIELSKAIIKSEHELISHDDEHETFYTVFAALAADHISANVRNVWRSQIGIVTQAARILLQYLLGRLQAQMASGEKSGVENETVPALSAKQLLLPIKALCSGFSTLTVADEATLSCMMKIAKLPSHIAISLSGDKESSPKEAKRSRTDLSSTILERLAMPMHDFAKPKPSSMTTVADSSSNKTSDSVPPNQTDSLYDVESVFVMKNIATLQTLKAGDLLLDMCLSLPNLSRYIHKYREAIQKKTLSLPASHSEASLIRYSLQALVTDLTLAWSAMSLPVLEPLSTEKLEKLSTLTTSCLYAAMCVATASCVLGITSSGQQKCTGGNSISSKAEDDGLADSLSITVVEKALDMFSLASTAIKNSTKAGGHVHQNHLLLGVWVLVTGLQTQLSTSSSLVPEKSGSTKDEKGKSPSKAREGSSRINLMKVQQGFGVLSVALASRAFSMMSTLLEDLQIEGAPASEANEASAEKLNVGAVGLSIHGNYTALNRAARILSAAPLNQLLFCIATISYRKACSLKRIQKHPPEGDNFSTSDSTTYYEDDLISCSEESSGDDDDDDSEPILGLWFEETISVPDSDKNGASNQNANESQDNKIGRGDDGPSTVVPEKGEPNGYILLATQIFQFMNTHFLSSESPHIWSYVQSGLTEQQMIILAAIVRDLDRETARTETGTISVYFGATLGQLYTDFSQALARYSHNLLARNVLSPTLQATLLSHLGVSPWAAPADSTTSCTSWPLQVYPRTLAILAQVLLLKTQQEKEAACVNIWHRLINTLVDNVCNPPQTFDVENEDLNVEHAQLLLFLFHSLNLMQKKSVLLITASGVIRCADVLSNLGASSPPRDTQLLHLARLLLLLEYLVKHLYDAPPYLLEQVQWNLFSATSLDADNIENKDGSRLASRIYVAWSDIENNYRKFGPQDEFSMRPRFYGLATAELNNQDQPKLDGLACNFILGTPDKLKYPQLVDALLKLLSVVDLSVPVAGVSSPNFTALCAMQYCFSLSWRLLLLLPPSTPFMDRLALSNALPSTSILMYSLVWGPRSTYKTFAGWMKDCLVKQGIFTQYAENLLKTVSKVINNSKYDLSLTKACITELLPQVPQGGIIPQELLPRLFELCLLDTIMARVQVQLDDSLIKPPPDAESSKGSASETPIPTSELVTELLPSVLNLTESVLAAIRSTLVFQMNDAVDPSDSVDFRQVLSVASSRSPKTSVLGAALTVHLPAGVRTTLEKWNALPCFEFPWNTYANDVIPAESYCLSVINSHVSSLSSQPVFTTNISLKHLLHSLVGFIGSHAELIAKFTGAQAEVKTRVVNILVPLTIDACTEYLHDSAVRALEKILGDADSEEHLKTVYAVVLGHVFTLINNYTLNNYFDPKNPNRPCAPVDCGILQDCLAFLEGLLDKPAGPAALEKFFDPASGGGDLVKILLSIASPQTAHSPQYGTRVLRFFNRIFAAEEKSPGDSSLDHLCHTISRLATVDAPILETWIRHVVLGGVSVTNPSPQVVPALLTCTTSVENDQNAANDTIAETMEEQPTQQTTMNVSVPAAATGAEEHQALVQENGLLLQSLTSYMVKERGASCEEAAVALLRAIIPFGAQVLYPPLEGTGFSELMGVMATLADAGTGRGHVELLTACPGWMKICKDYLSNREVLESLESPDGPSNKQQVMLDACCCLLTYVADVFSCLPSIAQNARATSPPWEGDSPPDIDTDWADDIAHEDEDSSAEDSDEDSLCSKLCTYTITQKEFMNQHWYHCHTCKMVDGVGVCTVCARVCHRGHDITYAKYGNFFCDCGAKEDGSCQALVKRSPQSSNEHQANQINSGIERAASNSGPGTSGTSGVEQMLLSSLRRRASSPVNLDKSLHVVKEKVRLAVLHEQLEHLREPLMQIVSENPMATTMLELLNNLLPAIDASCQLVAPVGCHQRCQIALKALHRLPKNYEYNDQIMVPTLGSQEGAFENVRMSYSGDQGQTIRQLLSAHMVRRVAMCCLSSPHGKRQHLAVSHEKGKITVLQLSALLKQADASKRKLTLTRLASAPIPFTVLSVTGNQWNEDFLAVCGLKDCHVLTFSSGGSVAEHLVLHPQLETGNFIIRAIWLPGSQTQLALITADFVKIYDLSKDALSPLYYFLVPTGKIRDCTFVCAEDNVMHMMLMSSAGDIYSQAMDEESQAKHGPFYVTNTLEVVHSDIRENNVQVCGGGVSIYYSHVLQLLFFSYAQGKSFIGALQHSKGEWSMPMVFPIVLNSSSSAKAGASTSGNATSGTNGASKPASQPLCQWSEVPNHPGLVCSLLQSSNNPVILMIRPDTILIQEIKVVPAKAKIMDMVALRHPSSHADHRTTLILLCEDGSLRIYMASMEYTGFWLSSSVQATSPIANLKSTRRKKSVKTVKPSGQVSFPVDFFEHCQAMNDVEFGGNDLLQIYNTQQIKHRLNTTGMYVVSTKPTGFTLEVTNSDSTLVMTGLRVLLGSQDQTRAPSYVEIFGRSIETIITRNRWFDIPFTREESLQADKKITVVFGPSTDPDGVTMVDSVKVYGKTKDVLGWHEEQEESVNPAPSSAPPATGTPTENDTSGNALALPPLTSLDRIVAGLLEVLDGCFTLTNHLNLDETRLNQRSKALNLATVLLTMPTPVCVQMYTKSLLVALHANRNIYHSYKDHALLTYVQQSLSQLRSIQDPCDLDAEAFYRLVLIARGVAVTRPYNLAKFADTRIQYDKYLVDGLAETDKPKPDDSNHLLTHMMSILWDLHGAHPSNLALAPVCVPGLTHVEATVHAMVEIIHAFTICDVEGTIGLAANMYREMLMHADPAVSFSAKQALCRVLRPRSRRRRVYMSSPPHCGTPGGTTEMESEKGPVSQPSQDSSEAEPHFEVDHVEPLMLLQADGAPAPPAVGAGPGAVAAAVGLNMNQVEGLLVGALGGALGNVPAGFAPLLDIPPDADDETMVELAIALSLQDHDGADLQNLQQGLANLGGNLQGLAQGLVQVGLAAQVEAVQAEAGHYSDTTASAGGSDDEGSTAATDGSTLRTSPAEQGGSAGSESGGSGVDSITGEHNVSGRSSAYGDNMQEPLVGARSETSSLGVPTGFQAHETDGLLEPEPDQEPETENSSRLHQLRLQLLERLLEYVPQLKEVGGVRSIPFMQVLLMLASDLDGEEEKDRACLENMLNTIIGELNMRKPSNKYASIYQRSNEREVHLVIMRLLSVLMSRSKSNAKSSHDSSAFAAHMCAVMLFQAGVIDYCLNLLKALLAYWKTTTPEESASTPGSTLLKPHLPASPPDMSPFFLRQYVKGHANDVFEAYPHLLTEMALRLPYQVQKHLDNTPPISVTFEQSWFYYLCEYMMIQQTPFVRRQVRKLLMFICGNKDRYRQLRDLHSLASHVKTVMQCVGENNSPDSPTTFPQNWVQLPYDTLVGLVEQLKACVEIATSRTLNWQRYCMGDDHILPFLLRASCMLDEAVAPPILQLLECAVCSAKEIKQAAAAAAAAQSANSTAPTNVPPPPVLRKDREKSDDSDLEQRFEDAQCVTLIKQINTQVPQEQISQFVKTFLLETNATSVRWQAHALILAIYKNSPAAEQEKLLDLMWQLWPQLPIYGRKAAQFVDLLGYFSLWTPLSTNKRTEYICAAVGVLRAQNQLLAHHPNASLYSHLAQYVELDGYYLESEPCLVCNNPELPMTSIKLSGIKIDSKFTTTTQIVKLVGSHTISRITLRIGDLKRTKMVRTINIYYNNRTVQAVVELKNKPAMWHKAKKVNLVSAQTEVKIEFPLPIVACNLMIEYADFYENIQASSETLQCPRCSASVPANPGVCANCGENVFQCHKCRAINYDEKDPFLCHACGFCKYAKFDYTLTARACYAVDPIESDDDRTKTVATINSHLEKADRVYKQLISNKPTLEMFLLKISEHRQDRSSEESSTTTTSSSGVGTQVNRAIQLLAQRYCGECRTSFEELSKIIQRVLACRRELVAYDRNQREQIPSVPERSSSLTSTANLNDSSSRTNDSLPADHNMGRCFGCASAATEHCLTLLRALACSNASRQVLCAQGLVAQLADNNLRRGTVQVQEEVRQLLCLLTRDNPKATEELCTLLMDRIALTLRGHLTSADLSASVRHEMALLSALVHKEDSCWEQKLRCVMQLFLMACKDSNSPVVLESITLPCLKILSAFIKPGQPSSKKNKEKMIGDLATISPVEGVVVNVRKWLSGDPKHTYSAWHQHMPRRNSDTPSSNTTGPTPSKAESRARYLMEKYGQRWRQRTLCHAMPLKLTDTAWLKQVLFNPSSRLARIVACSMLEGLCRVPAWKKDILDLLTGFLRELSSAGESASDFLALYQSLLYQAPWRQYLAVKGVLLHLADLLTKEIEILHRLEDTTLTSDLAQGYALKRLTELLASFLVEENIKQQFKGRLVGAVLNGYLSLRRLVVQRTRLIDDTQEKLLELLEEMTTGTEEETKAFMKICIETVQRCSIQDVRTPVFIFERLCSIIFPEENDVGEFFLSLDKDPQQEDFLQGRMLGNPYSSSEVGLGPLMRDVKNKICQDCELVALLEDDNGMELLVNNKIISLDLPVREVYKKVWVAEGGDGDVMRVVYRMRGLLGDATEEFVETLHAKSEQEVNNEEAYKMANVMADCGGLKIMLDRLAAIKDTSRSRPLLQVLLKLFRLCVKVCRNQEVLTQPELGAMTIFLQTLQLCLTAETASLTQQLLDIMETVLSKSASQPLATFVRFSQTFGGTEHIESLLTCTTAPATRNNSSVILHLARVLAAITYGNEEKMALLCNHFQSALDFNRFDYEHTSDDEHKLELFCILTAGIERNAIGNTLKDYIISLNIVKHALEYITSHAPCVKPTLLRTDSEEWKEYISKPALKYVLRFLTGLAVDHPATQLAVAAECIPIIHRLEQVSSDEHVGSLAENLLEALRTHAGVANRIEEVREQTRAEKKRLAMAMREKQLGALGMHTNEKGQVTAKCTMMQQLEDLGEETGLVCVICREGYKFQPNKVLGIYTFTKRCNIEEFESKARKTVGYSTVTHFNVVHVDCHMSAVRLARGRDEWESAALQNANTKCNGLLPLWGPQVPESAFASCLARHNTYLQECTGHRDIGYSSTVHDLKLLLLRFAQEKSFHDDTGGGGPQSNMHIIPYLIHMALYVINTTRCGAREEKTLSAYADAAPNERWIEVSYASDGPMYWMVLSLLLHSPLRWKTTRISHLKRAIATAQIRHVSPTLPTTSAGTSKLTDASIKDYSIYKPYLIFFGLVDGIYSIYLKKVSMTSSTEDQWPSALADYIRHNDEALMKASERLMAMYREELLPCATFDEFCDVANLLEDIPNPMLFLEEVLESLT